MNITTALLILTGIYLFGQYVNRVTKGWVGSTLAVVICMLAGFWSGLLPKEIGDVSGLRTVFSMVACVIIANIGTMIEPAKFKVYWRVVVTCIAGLAGLTITTLAVCGALFGQQTALAVYPTLTGSTIATQVMTKALEDLGLMALFGMVMLVQSTQGWIGIPMITIGVKIECRRSLELFRSGRREQAARADDRASQKMIDRIPAKWDNPFLHLFILVLISFVGEQIAKLTAPHTMNIVNSTIVNLVLGCVCRQLGLISRSPLNRTGLMDFALFGVIMGMQSRLHTMSYELLLASIMPILTLLILGAIGLLAGALIVGRILGVTPGLAISAVFGAYCGFPSNYKIAIDAISASAESEEEATYLRDRILDNVVMGSITSVTVLSIVIASVVIGLYFS